MFFGNVMTSVAMMMRSFAVMMSGGLVVGCGGMMVVSWRMRRGRWHFHLLSDFACRPATGRSDRNWLSVKRQHPALVPTLTARQRDTIVALLLRRSAHGVSKTFADPIHGR